jgi:hypothetical protein
MAGMGWIDGLVAPRMDAIKGTTLTSFARQPLSCAVQFQYTVVQVDGNPRYLVLLVRDEKLLL